MNYTLINTQLIENIDTNINDPRTIDWLRFERYPFEHKVRTDEIPINKRDCIIYSQPNNVMNGSMEHINRGDIYYYNSHKVDTPFQDILFTNKYSSFYQENETPMNTKYDTYIYYQHVDDITNKSYHSLQTINDSIIHRESIMSSIVRPRNARLYGLKQSHT